MRAVAASFIAMAMGWGVLNALIGLVILVTSAVSGAWSIREVLGAGVWWLACTAVVVGVAWLVVYLPVYVSFRRESAFWKWSVCVPVGFVVGAILPFGFLALPALGDGGGPGGLVLMAMAGMVGGVAAIVGRFLVDWSRHYRHVPPPIPGPGPLNPHYP